MIWLALFLALCAIFVPSGLYLDKLFEQRHVRRRLNEIHEDQANQSRLWNTANEP